MTGPTGVALSSPRRFELPGSFCGGNVAVGAAVVGAAVVDAGGDGAAVEVGLGCAGSVEAGVGTVICVVGATGGVPVAGPVGKMFVVDGITVVGAGCVGCAGSSGDVVAPGLVGQTVDGEVSDDGGVPGVGAASGRCGRPVWLGTGAGVDGIPGGAVGDAVGGAVADVEAGAVRDVEGEGDQSPGPAVLGAVVGGGVFGETGTAVVRDGGSAASG